MDLYPGLEPYQIALVIVHDWRNALTFFVLLESGLLINKYFDREWQLLKTTLANIGVLFFGYVVHVWLLPMENPNNTLPVVFAFCGIFMLCYALAFFKNVQKMGKLDVKSILFFLTEAKKTLEGKLKKNGSNNKP